MLTERQKKLVNDYGPRFCKRTHEIMDQFLYLCADAVSILTDEEWRECGESIEKTISELKKVQKIVVNRLKEAGAPVR